jgi:hypothetical protein
VRYLNDITLHGPQGSLLLIFKLIQKLDKTNYELLLSLVASLSTGNDPQAAQEYKQPSELPFSSMSFHLGITMCDVILVDSEHRSDFRAEGR